MANLSDNGFKFTECLSSFFVEINKIGTTKRNITNANNLADACQLIKSANIFATGKDTVPAKPAIRVINIIASLALVPLTFVT